MSDQMTDAARPTPATPDLWAAAKAVVDHYFNDAHEAGVMDDLMERLSSALADYVEVMPDAELLNIVRSQGQDPAAVAASARTRIQQAVRAASGVPCAWVLREAPSDSLGAVSKVVGVTLTHREADAWKTQNRDPWVSREYHAIPIINVVPQ